MVVWVLQPSGGRATARASGIHIDKAINHGLQLWHQQHQSRRKEGSLIEEEAAAGIEVVKSMSRISSRKGAKGNKEAARERCRAKKVFFAVVHVEIG